VGRKFERKGICREICKKKACITSYNYNNHRVSYEIGGEEFTRSDFESSNVDNFYNFYHSKLTLKGRRKKLQN
jgi:hypothetical protein